MIIRTGAIFLLGASLSTLACSGGGSGGSCTSAAPGTTTALEKACLTCVEASCASQFITAYGASWAAGDFGGGVCASFVACAQKCACHDQACAAGCEASLLSSMPVCEQALQAIATCEFAQCKSQCLGDLGALP